MCAFGTSNWFFDHHLGIGATFPTSWLGKLLVAPNPHQELDTFSIVKQNVPWKMGSSEEAHSSRKWMIQLWIHVELNVELCMKSLEQNHSFYTSNIMTKLPWVKTTSLKWLIMSNLTKRKTRYVHLTKKNKLSSQIECHYAIHIMYTTFTRNRSIWLMWLWMKKLIQTWHIVFINVTFNDVCNNNKIEKILCCYVLNNIDYEL